MQKKSDKKNSSKFQQILNISAKVFRKKGYHHATVSDIANEVGMKKGSLYYYMNSKEELLYKIISSAVKIYLNSLLEIMSMQERADILLRKAIIAHMLPIETDNDKIYIFLNELNSLSEGYRKDAEIEIYRYEKILEEIVERGKADGIFKPDIDSKILVLSIFGMCNWSVRWYRLEGKYNTKELAEMFANNILDGIKQTPTTL